MTIPFIDPREQFLDGNGDPFSGGTLTFYKTGTSTKLDTYSDSTRTTANSNPVVLDSAGRLPNAVYLLNQDYKVVLKASDGSTVWTQDPVVPPAGSFATLVADKTFTGNGSRTTFDLEVEPPNGNGVIAAIDGVLQNPDTYSISGTNVVFDTAPPNGSDVNIRNFGYAKAVETALASSVTYTGNFPGAVGGPLDEELDRRMVTPQMFGAVGDYDLVSQSGTDNTTAIDNAYAASPFVYFPPGNYLVTSLSTVTTHIDNYSFGPGNLYYDDGSTTKIVGNMVRAGVADPSGFQGNPSWGGFLVGGEGPSEDGCLMNMGGIHSWMRVKPTRVGSGIQYQLFSSAHIGIGEAQSGTDNIVINYGFFPTSNVEAGDYIGFGDSYYLILSIDSTSGGEVTQISVENTDSTSVTFGSTFSETIRHCFEYSEGTCDTSGTTVTWKSGDYFNTISVALQQKITINGTDYSIASYDSAQQVTLTTSAGTQSDVDFKQKDLPLARYISLLRLQGLQGSNEETAALYRRLDGALVIEQSFAGSGSYRKTVFRNGPFNDDNGSRDALTITDDGRTQFNEPLAPAADAVTQVSRYEPTAQTGGGTVEGELARWGANFAGSGYRYIAFGVRNNFRAPFLQGYIGGGTAAEWNIDPEGGGVAFGTHDAPAGTLDYSFDGIVGPHQDNTHTLGTGSFRWSEVFAATGTINTSDAREKTEPRDLSDAERRVAIRLSKLPGVYQWLDAIEAKGEDGARLHLGVTAQAVRDAFEAEGLDGCRYGVLCRDTLDDESGDRYGVRYAELAQWQIAGINARLPE